MEALVANLRPARYTQLKDATGMLEKMKLACKDYVGQYKEQSRVLTNLQIERESVDVKLKRLNE